MSHAIEKLAANLKGAYMDGLSAMEARLQPRIERVIAAFDEAQQIEGAQIPLGLCKAIEACRGEARVHVTALPSREQCLQAQRDLCTEHGWPEFAPVHSGICFACKQDIVHGFEEHWFGHITACPRCYHSYCE